MTDHASVTNPKKRFRLAILLTAMGAVLIFILSKALLIDQDFAGSLYENGLPRALAGFFLLAFPYIHQRLSGKRRVSFSHLPDGPVPLDAYTLSSHITLAYGILTAFAIAGAGLFLVWSAGMLTGFFATRAISPLTWVLLLLTLYHLGSWVGTRNTQKPFLTAVGITLGYFLMELMVTLMLGIDSSLQTTLGLMILLVPSVIVALLGVRAGKHRRFSHYMDFLLHPLAEKDKQAVVNNLYGEIRRQISEGQEIPNEMGGARAEYHPLQTQPVSDSDQQV